MRYEIQPISCHHGSEKILKILLYSMLLCFMMVEANTFLYVVAELNCRGSAYYSEISGGKSNEC